MPQVCRRFDSSRSQIKFLCKHVANFFFCVGFPMFHRIQPLLKLQIQLLPAHTADRDRFLRQPGQKGEPLCKKIGRAHV